MSWLTLNQVMTECWQSIGDVHQVLIKGQLSVVIDAQLWMPLVSTMQLFEETFSTLKLLVNGQ